MAKEQRRNQTQEVLAALQSWKSTSGMSDNKLLDRLVGDIESNRNMKIWADTDPNLYLPNPESSESRKKLRLINTVTGIRNVLVFSPVAITWAAISVVTSAFSSYEQKNPNSIINFLEFWQQGFGYLSDFWRLSNVAIFDAILVSVVIALTLAINYLSKQNLEMEFEHVEKVQQSKSELIYKLNEFFYEYKYPTAQQINKNVYSATKSLEKTLKSLAKIVVRLEKDILKYPNSTQLVNEIKALNKEVKKISKK